MSTVKAKKKNEKTASVLRPHASHLAEDVGGVPGPHEVGGVGGQSQHSFALDLLLQRLLVLPLQKVRGETVLARGTKKQLPRHEGMSRV